MLLRVPSLMFKIFLSMLKVIYLTIIHVRWWNYFLWVFFCIIHDIVLFLEKIQSIFEWIYSWDIRNISGGIFLLVCVTRHLNNDRLTGFLHRTLFMVNWRFLLDFLKLHLCIGCIIVCKKDSLLQWWKS